MSEPTPGPATDAMRLRPAAGRRRATEPNPGEATRDQLAERVDLVLGLHRPLNLETSEGPLCRECITPHPCATWRAAAGHPLHPTPEGDLTQ